MPVNWLPMPVNWLPMPVNPFPPLVVTVTTRAVHGCSKASISPFVKCYRGLFVMYSTYTAYTKLLGPTTQPSGA